LTPDLVTVHRFLDEAVVGIAGPETAIGDAIGLALKRLRDAGASSPSDEPNDVKHSVLVLLTDGESNAGAMPPLEAARLAHEAGLRIYTIGVGAAARPGFFGGGNRDLDEDTLKAIAKETGGEYFRATDADALQSVYRRIDQLEPAAGREQWLRPAQEWFSLPLGLALALSVAVVAWGAPRWA
jgi:Ca-activated chloride channel family protein